ncbi:hypothetical protein CLIB1444_03S11914 [[Candida] jaroonii]|uniref:Uncharacterized protein n=1 Tax=[Candida] jaroonii TaxID=467808 RepID=A0ACA9Y6A9_9ASCO|nr:hypothetical protein CLIB1444_03S11914 [[Candida] jaroonii]
MNKELVQYAPINDADQLEDMDSSKVASGINHSTEGDGNAQEQLFSFNLSRNPVVLPSGQGLKLEKTEESKETKENVPPSLPSTLFQYKRPNSVLSPSAVKKLYQINETPQPKTDFGKFVMLNADSTTKSFSSIRSEKMFSKTVKGEKQKTKKQLKREEEYLSRNCGDIPSDWTEDKPDSKDWNKIYNRLIRFQEMVLNKITLLESQIRDNHSSFVNDFDILTDIVKSNAINIESMNEKVNIMFHDIQATQSEAQEKQYQKARKFLDEIFEERAPKRSRIE